MGSRRELSGLVQRAAEAGTIRPHGMWFGTFGTAILVYTGPQVAGLAWRRR